MSSALHIQWTWEGIRQKAAKQRVAPIVNKALVRRVRDCRKRSVIQPEAIVPMTPPISSEAATIDAANAISIPLHCVRNEVPHSRMVKRIT